MPGSSKPQAQPVDCAVHLVLLLSFAVASFAAVPVGAEATRPTAPTQGVWLAEVVTDPKTDWDGSGSITSSDEYIVLWNAGPGNVDVAGWTLAMEDGTDETSTLAGSIAAHSRRVVLNPVGQINNNVRLVLKDAAGTIIDSLRLGESGVPDGDADSRVDEAVHLAGPWAAQKGPGTKGRGLGAAWIGAVARAEAPLLAWGTPWMVPGNLTLVAELHLAPGSAQTNVILRLGGLQVPAAVDATGLAVAGPFTAPGADAALSVEGTGWTIDTFPDGSPIWLRLDPTAPTAGAAADVPVSDAQGRLRWLPTPRDPESGIAASTLTFLNVTGEHPLPACAPLDAPPGSCAVGNPANVTLRFVLKNGAGASATVEKPVQVDTTPPTFAEGWAFPALTPPRITFPGVDEPLKSLRLEVAEDVTGFWRIANLSLDPAAKEAVDTTWTAGAPRAYRLVGVDRADLEGKGEWHALPAQASAARADLAPLSAVATQLARAGTATAILTFDAVLVEAPTLILEARGVRPIHLETPGVLAPDGRSVTYNIVAPPEFPRESRGTWRLAGGAGEGGLAVADAAAATVWDAEAPAIVARGATTDWIPASRHVVIVEAHDATDAKPRIDVTVKPKGVAVSGPVGARRVSFTGSGVFEASGVARDAAGNERPFTLRVALDASRPDVKADAMPASWSAESPIVLHVFDKGSGVNETSLRAWVRNATAEVEAGVKWNGTQARLSPPSGSWRGPFIVHAAVADRAGNLAEGAIGTLTATAKQAAPSPVSAQLGSSGTPGDAAAPAAAGPKWTLPAAPKTPAAAGEKGALAAHGGASSLWDPAAWADAAPAPSADLRIENGSLVWSVAGLGGLVTLGTVVRGVRRRRRRAKPPSNGPVVEASAVPAFAQAVPASAEAHSAFAAEVAWGFEALDASLLAGGPTQAG